MAERWYDPALPAGNGLVTGRTYPVDQQGQAPPEFGRRPNRFGILRLDLSKPRQAEQTEIGGTVLWAITGSDVDAEVDISFQEEFAPQVPFRPGQSIAGIPFSRIYVTNAQQLNTLGQGKTITFLYVVEDFPQFRIANQALLSQQVQVINPPGAPLPVSEVPGLVTNQGEGGMQGVKIQGSLGTHVPQVQVRANTVDCLIESWRVMSDIQQEIQLRRNTLIIVGGFTAFPNKNPDFANLNAQAGIGTGAVLAGTVLVNMRIEPGVWYELITTHPLRCRNSPIAAYTVHGVIGGVSTLWSTIEIKEPA